MAPVLAIYLNWWPKHWYFAAKRKNLMSCNICCAFPVIRFLHTLPYAIIVPPPLISGCYTLLKEWLKTLHACVIFLLWIFLKETSLKRPQHPQNLFFHYFEREMKKILNLFEGSWTISATALSKKRFIILQTLCRMLGLNKERRLHLPVSGPLAQKF